MAKTVIRLESDGDRNRGKENRVQERRQDLDAIVAVGPLGVAGRSANFTAQSANPSPATSVVMWAASASSARLFDTIPPITFEDQYDGRHRQDDGEAALVLARLRRRVAMTVGVVVAHGSPGSSVGATASTKP